MSVKAIRKALDMMDTSFKNYTEEADARAEALAEVDAIERAAKTLMTSEGKTVADDAEAVALLMRIAEEAP